METTYHVDSPLSNEFYLTFANFQVAYHQSKQEGGKMPRRINQTVDGGMHRRQADTRQGRDARDHFRQLKERLLVKFAAEREAEKQAKEGQ